MTSTAINHIAFTTALLATHNGYVTVHNTKTCQHRTFEIKKVKKNSSAPDYLKGERVVSLLIGPDRDNWNHWRRFGWIKDGKVRVWASQAKKDGSLVKMAALLNDTEKGAKSGLEYLLEGTCSHCNKDLTHPVSVHLGMGPHCGGDSWKALEKQLKAEAEAEAAANEPAVTAEQQLEKQIEAETVKSFEEESYKYDFEPTPEGAYQKDEASGIAANIASLFAEELAADNALCSHCAGCPVAGDCEEGLIPWNGGWQPCSHLEEDANAA